VISDSHIVTDIVFILWISIEQKQHKHSYTDSKFTQSLQKRLYESVSHLTVGHGKGYLIRKGPDIRMKTGLLKLKDFLGIHMHQIFTSRYQIT
jgi:hypothetical protein